MINQIKVENKKILPLKMTFRFQQQSYVNVSSVFPTLNISGLLILTRTFILLG